MPSPDHPAVLTLGDSSNRLSTIRYQYYGKFSRMMMIYTFINNGDSHITKNVFVIISYM